MNRFFKLYMTLVLLVMLASACSSPTVRTISGLNQLLDSLQLQYAPDDRIELWDVSVQADEGTVQIIGNLANREAYNAIVQAVDQHFSGVKNELILLPVEGSGVLVNALVNNSVIHLRKGPSSTKELVTQALLGAPVRILKTEGGKSLIQVPDRYIGWVNTAEVHAVNGEELAAYREAEKLVYIAQYGLSYSEPDELSLPVSDLVIGNILSKISEQSGFTQVGYPDGRLGWVKSHDLVPAEEIFYKTTLRENLVQTALMFH